MYRKQKPDSSLGRILTEMDEVASITQVALIEPLAFIAPDAEEEVWSPLRTCFHFPFP
jgi:FAD/FMN-containing dehydrogenase